MKVKYKLIISYLALIIITVSVLGILITEKSHNEFLKEVNEKNRCLIESIITTLNVRNEMLEEEAYSDLNFANTMLKDLKVDYGENVKVGRFNLPVLYTENQSLSLDNTVVNKLKQATGTAASVFLLNDNKFIRVSSTILKDDKKVLGTYISSDSDAYKKLINNEEYTGRIVVDNISYVTRMKPLLDKNKKVIGAIGVGNKIISDYLQKTLSNIKLGKTGYAYIVDSEGNSIIHPYRKTRHNSHRHSAKKMNLTQNGTITYAHNGTKKVGYYEYFKPWHWYIFTAITYDELNAPYKSIFVMSVFIGLIIIVFAGITAVLLTNNLINPINKLKNCMEVAGKGDFTVSCDVCSKDEMGVLASSFNNMLSENKRLVDKTIECDRLKTEFIANMSHELRTPLNIIFSTVQLLNVIIDKGEDLNTDRIKNYTGGIKQNCYRLVRLVNNLIDITKIDSGFMTIDLSNQNIVEIAEEITQSTVGYVQQRERTIIFDTDEEEKIMAFDAEKLERILLNLISNAVKFTKPGDTINVTLYDKKDHVIISVKDNGRGIPEEQLSQLFQRFKQIDPLLNRTHEGSGIGLTIVKALVELHGGTIEVKSTYGEGTEFIICLPAKIVPEEQDVKVKRDFASEANVENINIEFSDIYS